MSKDIFDLLRIPATTRRGRIAHDFVFEKAGHEHLDFRGNVTIILYADAIRYVTVSEPLNRSSPPDPKEPSVGNWIIPPAV
jgi:hypothetical protein